MDPSGSKRKGGLIPVTSLKKTKRTRWKSLFLLCGQERFTLSVRRRKKSYYRSGENKAETERPGNKLHHQKNTSRKWTRNPAI